MSVPTVSWAETTPAGTDAISAGDDRIRELKKQVREVVDVDHNFPSSGQSVTTGHHKKMTLIESADIGSGASGIPILGAQTISDRPELVYTTEDDDDVQLTEDDKVGGTTQNAIFANVEATSLSVKAKTNILCGFVPICGVIDWLKNLTGCPALPANFVECNGQIISDPESLFDNVTIPDLNGNNYFSRANATSGGTGGAATVTLTAAQSGLPAHTHSRGYTASLSGGTANPTCSSGTSIQATFSQDANTAADAASAHENLPPYYNFVKVIRIK
jgi:microcystin-dependent protein